VAWNNIGKIQEDTKNVGCSRICRSCPDNKLRIL